MYVSFSFVRKKSVLGYSCLVSRQAWFIGINLLRSVSRAAKCRYVADGLCAYFGLDKPPNEITICYKTKQNKTKQMLSLQLMRQCVFHTKCEDGFGLDFLIFKGEFMMKLKQTASWISLAFGALLLSACGSTGGKLAAGSDDIDGTWTSGVSGSLGDALEATKFVTVRKDGTLEDNGGIKTAAAAHTGYDAAMNAVKNSDAGPTNLARLGGSLKHDLDSDRGSLYLRDPSLTGQQYSRIGWITSKSGSENGYIAAGNLFVPDDKASLNATYSGAAIGTYDKTSEVVADFEATLNWSTADKTLDITVKNAHISENNISNGYTALKNVNTVAGLGELNFTQKLNWDAHQEAFINAPSTPDFAEAKLHGVSADKHEVTGVFERTTSTFKTYEGAFFGIKN